MQCPAGTLSFGKSFKCIHKSQGILNRGDIAVQRTANGLGESFFVFLLDN
jgi:hypothetical protein